MYVAMDRNTENEADIQNYACRRSRIIMWLRIFKSKRNEVEQEDEEEKLTNFTKVLKELVLT